MPFLQIPPPRKPILPPEAFSVIPRSLISSGDFLVINLLVFFFCKEGKSAKARYQQMFEQYNWSNKKLLEIGCGWGSFFDFGFTCNEYCGIDINSNLIKIATEKYPNKVFREDNITQLTPTNMFDVAISSGVAGNRQGPSDTPNK